MNNVMRTIRVEKVTLNVGAGKDQKVLEKGLVLLKHITGINPVKTITQKRLAAWGLRPGLPIGCKVTLRGKQAVQLIPQLLSAKDNVLRENNFDDHGNISFGIEEYIDIHNIKYLPEIGIMGLQTCITLERPGFRIKKRKLFKKKIPAHHRISRKEAMQFMQDQFKVTFGDQE
ncbi:MAG: 50S ribosomal protein L5 [archaeon]